jgi:hypothetical protein
MASVACSVHFTVGRCFIKRLAGLAKPRPAGCASANEQFYCQKLQHCADVIMCGSASDFMRMVKAGHTLRNMSNASG